MRSLKTSGDMTRGRGMTEQQRAVWLLPTPACATLYESSEQHRRCYATPARLEKDFKDASKIVEYVVTISPFTEDSDLINIHTWRNC